MLAHAQTLILTGPTGSGKSALAIDLAERLGAEIVSMDSMALYRRMDIGTAKPTAEHRHRVPHHLLDVLEPWESASVAWWLDRTHKCCRDIVARGKRPLIVGGTPLYLKALLHGLFEGPPADAAIRHRLSAEAAVAGTASLHARLAVVDPVSAARLHRNDERRIIRALEVWELTGRPISAWQTQWRKGSGDRGQGSEMLTPDPCPLTPDRCLCLHLPRAELYARIDARVERMFAEGWAEEAAALRRLQHPLSREARQALGYKEMFDFLDGLVDRTEAIARIQLRSRRFAKRQLSWFRQLTECHPISSELTFTAWGLTM